MAGKADKITVIGGGSSYTPELIEGLIKRHHELPFKELWLVDIGEGSEKMSIISDLAKRMIARAGSKINVYSTTDRSEGLSGADYVLIQLRVGSLEARYLDEAIPAKHGILGQETTGAGGLFKAFRTIPVVIDIINDCKILCPEAWIISFSNPVGMITEAVFRYTDWKRFVGLCNLPIGLEMAVAGLYDVEVSKVRVDIAGLNHLICGLDVFIDGKNVMEEVLLKIGGEETAISAANVYDVPWAYEFLKNLEAIPCVYHRYYWMKDEMLEHSLNEYRNNNLRATAVKEVEKELFKKYSDPSLDVKPPELEKRGGAYYSDTACNLMASIHNNKGDVQAVNTLNGGAVSCLPGDVVVEVSSRITSEGPLPVCTKDLPTACRGLVQQMKAYELQACQAAVSGNYGDALVAIITNPLVQSQNVGRKVLNDLLIAHSDYLPQFKQAIDLIK